MKYTYQDSTMLPIQRDLITDLYKIVEVATVVLPIENEAIEISGKKRNEISSLENRIIALEKFSCDIISYVSTASKTSEHIEMLNLHNAVVDVCYSNVAVGIKNLKKELEQKIKEYESYIADLENKMLPLLNPLFDNEIYDASKSYTIYLKNEYVQGIITGYISGVEYVNEVVYSTEPLHIGNFKENIQLPMWVQSGIINKGKKVKMLDISDFLITNIDYDDQSHLEIVFENKKQTYQFKIIYNFDNIEILYENNDINADKLLSQHLNLDDITDIASLIKNYLVQDVISHNLLKLSLDNENAIFNHEVFDCFKIITEHYGEIIEEALSRNLVKDEITIKIESSDGSRNEKYVKKQDLFSKLAGLGSEGLELASILNLD